MIMAGIVLTGTAVAAAVCIHAVLTGQDHPRHHEDDTDDDCL